MAAFLLIAQKLEIAQMSVNRRMYKQIVIYLYNRILYSNKREQTTDTPTVMDEAQKHCVGERDSQTQKSAHS